MRLASWNCQTGLDSNWDVIDKLDGDVISVQECGPDTEKQALNRLGWSAYWQRGRHTKGVAVLARSPFRLRVRERAERCLVSAMVSGPDSIRFRLVGFWAMTPSLRGVHTYPQQATRLIEQLPEDGTPSVVAGDFNASWRNSHHRRNVQRLTNRGLVSVYHSFFHEEHDVGPRRATSYFRWSREHPYHMDYIFVPETWRIKSVELGTFEAYVEKGLSDHVPLLVSVDPRPAETI